MTHNYLITILTISYILNLSDNKEQTSPFKSIRRALQSLRVAYRGNITNIYNRVSKYWGLRIW